MKEYEKVIAGICAGVDILDEAAIRELDKIEMARQLDGVYRLDHEF